jgi:predicted ATPase
VLIGANGSEKSNLIEAISLLQSAPRNLASGMQRGDGVQARVREAAQTTAVSAGGCACARYSAGRIAASSALIATP